MQDIKMHCDDGSLNYSFDMMDTCDNPKKKTPTKTHFRSVEDCKRNEHSSRTIFDGTDGERDGYGGNFFCSLIHLCQGLVQVGSFITTKFLVSLRVLSFKFTFSS